MSYLLSVRLYHSCIFVGYMLIIVSSMYLLFSSTIVNLYLYLHYILIFIRYKWINQGWSLERRIGYFEERWSYFAGFGNICSFVDVMFVMFMLLESPLI